MLQSRIVLAVLNLDEILIDGLSFILFAKKLLRLVTGVVYYTYLCYNLHKIEWRTKWISVLEFCKQ